MNKAIPDSSSSTNPTTLLQAQVSALNRLVEAQKLQIRALRQTNRHLNTLIEQQTGEAGSLRQVVKIGDIDIPFWNLVGLLLKVALASIPAGLMMIVVYGIISLIVFVLFSILGVMTMLG